MAKTLIKFSGRHPKLRFSRFVIRRFRAAWRAVRLCTGWWNPSQSKKYIVPSVVVSPIFAGCVAAVYVGTGAGRFDPARQALVFNAQRALEGRSASEDRRSYQRELNHLELNRLVTASTSPLKWRPRREMGRLLRNAVPASTPRTSCASDTSGEETVSVGVSGSNIFANDASMQFTQQLLEARLHAELRRGSPPRASESDITRDWNLLQKAMNGSGVEVAARSRRPRSLVPRRAQSGQESPEY